MHSRKKYLRNIFYLNIQGIFVQGICAQGIFVRLKRVTRSVVPLNIEFSNFLSFLPLRVPQVVFFAR